MKRKLLVQLSRLRRYRSKTSDYTVNKGYKLSYGIMTFHHVIVIAAGFAGFIIAPSPAVATVVGGSAAAWLWSGVFVLFGTTALISRLFRRARAEVVSVLTIAAARVLWSGILVWSVAAGLTHPGSLQIALILLAGAVFLLGWSLTTLAWLSGIPLSTPVGQATMLKELRDHVREVVERTHQEE